MSLLVTIGLTGVVSAGALAAFVFTSGASAPQSAAPAVMVEIAPPEVITQRYTKQMYDALADGMTYDAAARELGYPGEHATKSAKVVVGGEALNAKSNTFVWENPDRSTVVLVFDNDDKLIQRAFVAAPPEAPPSKPAK